MAISFIQLLIILATAEMCCLWRHPFIYGRSKKCECFCGTQQRILGRIAGGDLVKDTSIYPFMVALHNRYVCGGVLLTPEHVLTAAHCIHDLKPVADIKLMFGALNYATPKHKIYAKEAVIHEEYDSRKDFLNDIAIIVMDEKVEYTNFMRPACLPQSSKETYNGRKATVIGYGLKGEETSVDGFLRRVKLNIFNLEICKRIYKAENKTVYDTNVCAGYEKGIKDSCNGDSGGPLVLSRRSDFILIGIVSWGTGCARPNSPGVYIAVNKYLDWIKKHVGDQCLCFIN